MAALQSRLGTVTPHGRVKGEPRVFVGWESVITQVSVMIVGAAEAEAFWRKLGRARFMKEKDA